MALMTLQTTSLGTYTFVHNPAEMKRMSKPRSFATSDTLTANVIFDWGFKSQSNGMPGTRWVMRWPKVPRSVWTSFRSFYESSETITLDPKERARTSGEKYTVKLLRLDSEDIFENQQYVENFEIEFEVTGTV